jgi:putative phosphoesterase
MPSSSRSVSVGLISDTHGLLRPEALAALRGSRYIIHAGDIGDRRVLEELARIAPVTAVRGNNDKGAWARALPETDVLQVGKTRIYVIHNVAELDLDPAAAGFHVVVAGHSHRPKKEMRDGVLFVNPGSAGPRRFNLPIAVGKLLLSRSEVEFRVIEFDARAPQKQLRP